MTADERRARFRELHARDQLFVMPNPWDAGSARLLEVLIYTLLVNGVMALFMIIWKRRVGKTLRNIAHMTAAFFRFHLPGADLTIDNPDAIKVPFGVAAAIAVLIYVPTQLTQPF